jgi:hypothetical protein
MASMTLDVSVHLLGQLQGGREAEALELLEEELESV